MKKALIAAALIFTLSGCSSGATPNAPDDGTQDLQSRGSGWITVPGKTTEVFCMWWNWGSGSQNVSCNWETEREVSN